MAKTDSNLWRQVSPYLDEVLELDASSREAWLADIEKVQPQIAREVRELLKLHAAVRESGFLEQ
jgi:neutral trehalase